LKRTAFPAYGNSAPVCWIAPDTGLARGRVEHAKAAQFNAIAFG
jgi:hypothetical protein